MTQRKLTGGDFIACTTRPEQVFIPEEWTEEQRMIAKATEDFIVAEIHPRLEEIDSMKDPRLVPSLLEKAGELGLLGTSIPERYGGFGMDFNTSMLIAEKSAMGFSFGTTFGAHTGIGTLPVLYYGNEEQKQKYLPDLASGRWKASYCLTEPTAGSDANSGKTRAVLNSEGTHYLINGQKMWITNGGFADLYIVFAKVDDDENLSAFIVERTYEGLSLGAEEKKLGIKGSSTVQVFFNNCKVPKENMLSERGNGFKIALNILNIGRIKLATAACGGAKMAMMGAVLYARERKQFNTAIIDFGAIRHKLGQMALEIYNIESASYRAGQCIDQTYHQLVQGGMDPTRAKLKSVEEYSVECALLKVYASEALDYVVDEVLQIHGGMGFSAELPIERGYRDARITRIYEGTNEINRMLGVGMLFKKAFKDKTVDMKGELKKLPAMLLRAGLSGSAPEEDLLLARLKMAYILVALKAAQKFQLKLQDEQEILMDLSDALAAIYMAESAWLRSQKVRQGGTLAAAKADAMQQMARLSCHEAAIQVAKSLNAAIAAHAEGTDLRFQRWAVRQLTRPNAINPKSIRRKLVDLINDENGYPF
jgi:alkylation response protein AidB-like acyl-CoA dehydrogenase